MPADPIWTARPLAFDASHPTAAGHFPGNPILPGAVLLAEIVQILAPAARDGELRAAKFSKAVRPGDRLELRWTRRASGDIQFEARFADGAVAVSGTLAAGARAA